MIRSNNSCAWEPKFVVMGLLLASLMFSKRLWSTDNLPRERDCQA